MRVAPRDARCTCRARIPAQRAGFSSWEGKIARDVDSPLEEGVSSEPVSEARPYRGQVVEASTRGGGSHKKNWDQPHALPIDKMSERRKTGGAAAQGPRHAKKAGH